MSKTMKLQLLLLMHPPFAEQGRREADRLGLSEVTQVQSLAELRALPPQAHPVVLLSFGTSVIVPADVLARPGLTAFNIHAASPAYPGRDPHHFAAYEQAREYGATLHRMTSVVDQGPIVDVELFPVERGTPPHALLARANAAGLTLLHRLLAQLAAGELPEARQDLRWTGPVRRRKDFVALCRVDPDMSAEEFERRLHAARMPRYANLWTQLHGRRFVLCDSES